MRDLARRLTGNVLAKYLSHDLGFFLDDFQFARLTCNSAIAVRSSSGVTAISDDAFHSATSMDDEIFDKHFAHQSAKGSVKLANFAAGSVDHNPDMIEVLACGVIIGLIAKKPIHILSDDYVEQAGISSAQEALEAGTIGRPGS